MLSPNYVIHYFVRILATKFESSTLKLHVEKFINKTLLPYVIPKIFRFYGYCIRKVYLGRTHYLCQGSGRLPECLLKPHKPVANKYVQVIKVVMTSSCNRFSLGEKLSHPCAVHISHIFRVNCLLAPASWEIKPGLKLHHVITP